VLTALALDPNDRLLDVGCGGGVFLRRALASGCSGVGLDHSHDMVRHARSKVGGAAEIVEGKAEALPFPDGAFNAVSCLVAFFFFADAIAVLREMRRVLDPEQGRVAIMTTAPEARGTSAAPYPLATRGHFYTDGEFSGTAAPGRLLRRMDRVAVGARGGRKGIVYRVADTALKHGAGAEHETRKSAEAYARFPPSRRSQYREGSLPDL